MSLCRIIDLFGEAPIMVIEVHSDDTRNLLYAGQADLCPDNVQHKEVLDGGVYAELMGNNICYVIVEVEED